MAACRLEPRRWRAEVRFSEAGGVAFHDPDPQDDLPMREGTPWWEDRRQAFDAFLREAAKRGFAMHTEVNEALPPGLADADMIEDVLKLLDDFGIRLIEDDHGGTADGA